ncbi:bifunctional metallophosphatase/5'-nucleotidase [Sphingomonas aracearum]|uniref:Bifunctional metallophosphatase/5'-nucleotidase n=1 Tax=Sphingomonas aracearum TaxID=2283317 RepID=A0A369VUK5_9SPHN|nr:bifunctional metallophosphatase/5'-nucleotidase [Sphingomonas aracearum]RDE04880.1 bifunctional metallophosphatase/5'-nucleotidase [Sphingomonas aracearum]
MTRFLALSLALLASACATVPPVHQAGAPVEVGIVAINDFHGNLEPPHKSVPLGRPGASTQVPAGGAAYLASAVAQTRRGQAHSIVVSAGDMVGASPLTSSLFLDEPSVLALNAMGLELGAVGNHEFDRGQGELFRLAKGGCEKFTLREPCQVDRPFPGARFGMLAANVRRADGSTLFPGTALKRFGAVTIGFIGETLKSAPDIVSAQNIEGLRFEDEADTASAAAAELRRQGADAVVLLIHQGLQLAPDYTGEGCAGLSGSLMPILAKLDGVDLVVSGHSHNRYICDYREIDAARPFLVTSAEAFGTLLTDIRLTIDPVAHRVVARTARNVIVQGEAFTGASGAVPLTEAAPRFAADPAVGAIVARYAAAARTQVERRVGTLTGPALRAERGEQEAPLNNLIADAQVAAIPGGEIGFMNSGGVRTDLLPAPDGQVTYGQIYAVQPFGNVLEARAVTGRQLLALLEQQVRDGRDTPNLLAPSSALRYTLDLRAPVGQRVRDATVNGKPLDPARTYRVVVSNFVAQGGDGFTGLRDAAVVARGGTDLEALEAYLRAHPRLSPPAANRVTVKGLPAR